MTEEKRTIVDALGHKVELALESEDLVLCVARPQGICIAFSKPESEILHAFLSIALKMPRNEGRREILSDHRVLELVDKDNPKVRIIESDSHVDLHPASWEPIMYEIALLLPRMSMNRG